MMPLINKTSNEIKDRYKYEIDMSDFVKTGDMINYLLFFRFSSSLNKYNFFERIENLIEIIKKKKDKIDNAILKSYENKLMEIKDSIEKLIKKLEEEFNFMKKILNELTYSYKNNIKKPDVLNTYKRICGEILDKEAEKYIKYEKIILEFNDDIIDINNKLNF